GHVSRPGARTRGPPCDRRRALMGSALQALLDGVLADPPAFYRERLARAGLRSADGPAALARLPLTRRDELVRDQLAHPPHGTRRAPGAPSPVRLGVTGSGADLLLVGWSAAELARERRAGARLLARLGVEAGVRVANTLPGALVSPGSLLLGDVVEELGGLDVPLGEPTAEATARVAWDLVDRVEPAVLVLEPATALVLLGAAPRTARPWWRGIVWLARGGSTATPVVPPAVGFAGWQRTWLAVAEATSFVARSCAAGSFRPDVELVAEVVHPVTGAALPRGHDGIL